MGNNLTRKVTDVKIVIFFSECVHWLCNFGVSHKPKFPGHPENLIARLYHLSQKVTIKKTLHTHIQVLSTCCEKLLDGVRQDIWKHILIGPANRYWFNHIVTNWSPFKTLHKKKSWYVLFILITYLYGQTTETRPPYSKTMIMWQTFQVSLKVYNYMLCEVPYFSTYLLQDIH